jgi:Ca2+-dependent lipid-binding protein
MDLTSANDVYVEVTLGSDTQRTTIIDDGGSACEWNGGSGETLSFDGTMAGIPTVQIGAWDFDLGSANDLIGSATLNLRDRDADKKWNYDSWVTLGRKGKECGQVHVNIVWDPDPEEPQRRGVRATFLAARDLPKADIFGQNDVYAELTVGDTTLRTSVLYDGGSSPRWSEGGEILECFPCITGIPIIQVKLFDEDVGSADDELGAALINFKKHSTKDQWEEQDWFPLRTRQGKDAGAVHLKVAWESDPPKPKRRGVRVTLLSARDLSKADSFGENDCYAQVSFGETVCKTSVLYGGGCNPRWGSGSDGEVLEAFPEVCGIPTFEIKLFDEDVGSADDELGAAMLNLRAHNPDRDFEEEGWWPLKCKGKDAGKVQVTIQWLADPPKPTRRSVCIAIKAARGLRKADIVVRMQSFSSI